MNNCKKMYLVDFEPFNLINKEIKQKLHEKLMINYLPLIRFTKIFTLRVIFWAALR